MSEQGNQYPRLSDLPGHEQVPFRNWLEGQTCPLNEDGSLGYYPWDYERWKLGLPILD